MKPSRTRGAIVATVLSGLPVALLAVAAAGDTYTPLGNTDPGSLTTFAFTILRFTAIVLGAGCLGGLVYGAFVVPGRKDGQLTAGAFAATRFAAGCGFGWFAATVAAVPFSAAVASGQPVGHTLRPDVLLTTMSATEEPKAWLCAAIAAGFAAVLAWQALAWRTAVAGAAIALAGTLPVTAVGRASVGAGHDLATNALFWHVPAASIWLGALIALLIQTRRDAGTSDLLMRRYQRLSMTCFVVVTLSGAVVGLVLARPDNLVSEYGLALAVETLLVLGAGLLLVRRRRRNPMGPRWRLLLTELILLALATGGSVALTALVPPSFVTDRASAQETILGYDLNQAPDFARMVLNWRPDLLFGTVAVIAVVFYLAAVRRLRRRGDHWSARRTAAWLAGWALIAVVTSSGLGVYAPGAFSLHMITHMALNMFAPVLLVLGGPVTLALRALPAHGTGTAPGAREWVVSLVHSPATKFLAHPAVATILFAGSFYALYFSGLFGKAMLFHWAHQLMKAHFLLSGYLFAWVVVGTDRTPRRLPHLARLGMLFAVMPFHAFFGVILMSTQTVLGYTYYHYLALPWAGDLLADQRLGGGIAWASGELPMVVMVVALLAQWARSDERQARRADRRGDGELDAYNAMLAELAANRK
ncbi:cytochrome c oxidase assembly protein [Amycolatopsis azurea]|uniref:cytochrome c oxidase assembly protein n=1 Tax=Amycolatopsis azurea TaxID=36819 RepID=UPI00382EDC73